MVISVKFLLNNKNSYIIFLRNNKKRYIFAHRN